MKLHPHFLFLSYPQCAAGHRTIGQEARKIGGMKINKPGVWRDHCSIEHADDVVNEIGDMLCRVGRGVSAG